MTPGWPNSLPEPAGPLHCVRFESVRGTQIKRLSFFGVKLTCGRRLRKDYCYSEIRRPGWDPLIHVPGSGRKGTQGAVHTHKSYSDKVSVICAPVSFFKESAANITGCARLKHTLSPHYRRGGTVGWEERACFLRICVPRMIDTQPEFGSFWFSSLGVLNRNECRILSSSVVRANHWKPGAVRWWHYGKLKLNGVGGGL